MEKIDVKIDFSEDDVHVFQEHSGSNDWFMGRIIKEIMKMGYTETQAKKAINPESDSNTGLASLAGPIAWWGMMKAIRDEIRKGERTITMVFRIPNN